jgi:CubicO group peptidase (beta-lactamase class C family)
LADIDRSIANADIIVCATLSRLVTGQNKSADSDHLQQIIQKILAAQKPVVWVALGNPFLLRLVPQLGTYLCSFSYSDNSQIAAAKALAGEIPVSGKMPVSIPGIAKIGAGLDILPFDMTLKPAEPEDLGLAANAFEKTSQLLSALVEEQTLPGAQLIIGYKGKIVRQLALGKSGFLPDALSVSSTTVFNLSSIAKPAGIMMAALSAVDSGKILLESQAKNYLAELSDAPEGATRIQDLIQSISIRDKAVTQDKALSILDKILFQTTGMPWHQLMAEQWLSPLGMKNTYHQLPKKHPGHMKEISVENFELFSNVEDMAVFAQMLLNRGVYNRARIAGSKNLAKFIGANGPWSKFPQAEGTPKLLSESAFGCNAANGSFFWIDPAKELFMILLTHGRTEDARISEAQRKMQESILAAFPR